MAGSSSDVVTDEAVARVPFAWRALASVATIVALGCVALVVAFWAWRWFGPSPVHIPRNGPADPIAALARSNLFGAPASAPEAPASPAREAQVGEIRLLGVFAERDGRGHALVRFADGTSRLVASGGRIDARTTLVAVGPDGVTVRIDGAERRIALRGSPPAPERGASASPKPQAPRADCAAPVGFAGAVVRLNAELLQGLIAQPETWTPMIEARDGALVVRDETGFAAMLGLKREDRIEQANGIPLRATEDVIGAVLRPLAASQAVRLSGTRQGQRRELLLQNAGRCPG